MPDRTPRLPSDRDATGRDLGSAELELLRTAIESGHLNSTGGTLVPKFELDFATRFAMPAAIACANGSAAVHAALGALDLVAGDEVITTPITDMGAILPIHYEGATVVFADVEPASGNVTAETIAACVSSRTRAVIVTHLFGLPCAMDAILEAAKARGLVVIEDCAQAFLAEDDRQLVGTRSEYACYSFQQGKHMTTGEGGMVVCANEARADAVRRFVNKGWGYGDASPDHDRRGLNYRMTELQAAVGIAQLQKLDGVVSRRRAAASRLHEGIRHLDGIRTPLDGLRDGSEHAYWRFLLDVDAEIVPGGVDAMGRRLAAAGIHNAPRYLRKPAYDCALFDADSPRSIVPVGATRPDCPGAREALTRMLVLPWNEHYTAAHVDFIAGEIRAVHATQRLGTADLGSVGENSVTP